MYYIYSSVTKYISIHSTHINFKLKFYTIINVYVLVYYSIQKHYRALLT